jgi:cyclopropane-fatty-acyl-phospholipid synthase
VVSLEIRSPEFYKDVVLRGSLGAGEAWTAGIWDTSDLEALIRIMLRNRDVLDGLEKGPARLAAWVLRWFDNRNANSKTGSRRNIAAHYDLGNEFFAAFLDSSMTYSCAVFEDAELSLEVAQRAKLDRLCRKLELGSEDHVLEIGTGWGSFAIHAAGNYGCRVTTTTISQRQFEEARRRVQVAGLEDRVEILLQDYRDLNGQFDKLASIEMIEAVGDNFLDTWFAACSSLLKPEGRMGIQAITIADQHYASALREVDFIKRYIFPGSFIPSVTRMMNAMTDSTDLRLVHLEDFGPHYAETLRRWRSKLNAVEGELLEQGHTAEFLRMWNYYLGYCAGGFEERFLGVSQLVFRKPLAETQPLLGSLA